MVQWCYPLPGSGLELPGCSFLKGLGGCFLDFVLDKFKKKEAGKIHVLGGKINLLERYYISF